MDVSKMAEALKSAGINVGDINADLSKYMEILPKEVPGWVSQETPPLPAFQYSRIFSKGLEDGGLFVVIERRRPGRDEGFPEGRWHLSISHKNKLGIPDRVPTWEELKEIRYAFMPKDINMAIMFPPASLYYNLHPTCLHLLEIPVELALDPRLTGI